MGHPRGGVIWAVQARPESHTPIVIALDPCGRAIVTRDMELVRKILLEVEGWKDTNPRVLELPDYEHNLVFRHVEYLSSAGLIETVGKSMPIGPSAQSLRSRW
jgi:hypothetical protein